MKMTQLEALKIAYDKLSNMMPYGDENNEIFKYAEIIEKMIHTREMQSYKNQLKKFSQKQNRQKNVLSK